MQGIFDEFWEEENSYGKAAGDPNTYTTGRIGKHNVVLAHMPGIGKSASASLAASFCSSFDGIRLGLVVGICGGVPTGAPEGEEIILGDVIISTGVVQFDFGRQYLNKVVRKDILEDNLGRHNLEVRGFLQKMSGLHGRKQLMDNSFLYLTELCYKPLFRTWGYPGASEDILYPSAYHHKHQQPEACRICASQEDSLCQAAIESSCEELNCDTSRQIPRLRLQKMKERTILAETEIIHRPDIHFGKVASGDLVMRSEIHRDRLANQEKVIAFDMEAAGVWDHFSTVVIKGVCDYADSHKNKKWQKYAAATAAACMKAFLKEWRGMDKPLHPLESWDQKSPRSSKATLEAANTLGLIHQPTTQTSANEKTPVEITYKSQKQNVNSIGHIMQRTNNQIASTNTTVGVITGHLQPVMQEVVDDQMLATLSQTHASSQATGSLKITETDFEHKYSTAELLDLLSELDPVMSSLLLVQTPVPLTNVKLSVNILSRLQSWWKSPDSELLWIQESTGLIGQPSTSTAVLGLAQKASRPTAAYSFNCDFGIDPVLPDFSKLNGMVLALVLQIIQGLPNEFHSFADFHTTRLAKLDGSVQAIEEGLSIIKALLQVRDGPQIIIIDRLDFLDRSTDHHVQSGLRTLLDILQPPPKAGLDVKSCLIKTLLVTPGQTQFLMAAVKLRNRCEDLRVNIRKEVLLSSMFAADILAGGPR